MVEIVNIEMSTDNEDELVREIADKHVMHDVFSGVWDLMGEIVI